MLKNLVLLMAYASAVHSTNFNDDDTIDGSLEPFEVEAYSARWVTANNQFESLGSGVDIKCDDTCKCLFRYGMFAEGCNYVPVSQALECYVQFNAKPPCQVIQVSLPPQL